MPALLAAAPLALIIALMLGLRWSAARAGVAGLAVALLIAYLGFGYGDVVAGEIGRWRAGVFAFAEAGFTAATILWIIFPALCVYEIQKRSGAFDVIRAGLASVSTDRRVQVLLIAWFFALFMEGAAGFGTPVALAAPLLVSLGFTPLKAVTLALIGHAAGVSFGAVGTPILAQADLTGESAQAIAQWTGLMHLLVGAVLVVLLMRVADDGRFIARDGLLAILAAFCFLVPAALIAWAVGPELPTFAGAVVGAMVFVLAVRRFGLERADDGAQPRSNEKVRPPATTALLHAAAPYLLIVTLILITRMIPPIAEALRGFSITWSLPGGFSGRFDYLYHPGTMLMTGFVLGALLQGRSVADMAQAAAAAALRLAPVLIALVAMLAISRLMVHAGMIDTLAETAAGAGGAWPLLAAGVGALGTFVTGSATASNILLSEFQTASARSLDLPLVVMLAAQSFGAAVGNMACPHNIIAGGATVGLRGREGDVLRATLPATLIYALLGGIVTLLLIL
ncbi:MAG: L-lactate permease [Salinarimonas sp.]|nr:L-lactate permease [Salinarimonas sp.]